MRKGILYGIGVGPGEASYLTLKGYRLLQEIRRIIIPVTAKGGVGTAYEIVKDWIPPDAVCIEQVYPMSYDRSVLCQAWEANAAEIGGILAAGEDAAFLTLGDPFVYSTYSYLYDAVVQKGYQAVTVPGITSFQAASARIGRPLTRGDEKLAVLTGGEDMNELEAILRIFDTVVVVKVNRVFPLIYRFLAEVNLLHHAYLVQNLGMADERVELLAAVSDPAQRLPYFTTLVIRKGCER